jgi:hypothetical protein
MHATSLHPFCLRLVGLQAQCLCCNRFCLHAAPQRADSVLVYRCRSGRCGCTCTHTHQQQMLLSPSCEPARGNLATAYLTHSQAVCKVLACG